MKHEQFDVAILGAGIEGALLATLLAYKGAKVLIIDATGHPRYALGESTVRHTFRMLKIIGERWGVPELKEKFSSGDAVHKYVSHNCGEKRNFGFIYHRDHQHQIPSEANQLVIPPFREGYEAHLFRQDIDMFLTNTAIHYGAVFKPKTLITEVDINQQGVTLRSQQGDMFKARFIADASGPAAVLGRMFKLREDPPRLKINSRCVYTLMIDVKPYDDLNLPNGVPRMPERWYNGTCHHIFDGGWVWVIPFNNRKGSINPLVSVGLSYNINKYPKPANMTPEEEWEDFLSRYPSVREQFKDAKPVQQWVSTGRLQSSCSKSVGYRYIITAAANGSGFIDALFSRGMANSVESVNAITPRLLAALKDDDFSPERFEYVERLHANNLYNSDRLVHGAYISFRDYDMWNAWFRIWAIGVGLGDLRLASIYRRYRRSHDDSILPDNEEPMGLFYSNHLGFKKLFDAAYAEAEAVEAGQLSPKVAAERIFKLVGEADFTPPANRMWDPEVKCINVGQPVTMLKTIAWVLGSAPPEIRKLSLSTISDLNPFKARKAASSGA